MQKIFINEKALIPTFNTSFPTTIYSLYKLTYIIDIQLLDNLRKKICNNIITLNKD